MRPPPSGGVNSLDVLYAQAAEAARTGSHGFSLATRFFPLDLRRAAHAVYWFCYYTRRLATQAENPEQARTDLDRWAWMVAAGLRGELARHPVLDVFLDTVDHRAIPHELPLEMIEGVRMDIPPRSACILCADMRIHKENASLRLVVFAAGDSREPC